MTVQDLIDALTALNAPTLQVRAEGCDCINPVVAVRAQSGITGWFEDVPHVLIEVDTRG